MQAPGSWLLPAALPAESEHAGRHLQDLFAPLQLEDGGDPKACSTGAAAFFLAAWRGQTPGELAG